ncbi:hypothetical protein ACOSP7_013809 [Xanthoceras sorbifolium]
MKTVSLVIFFLIFCSTTQALANNEAEPSWFWRGKGGFWNLPHPPLSAPKWPSYPAHPPLPSLGHPFFSNPKMTTCLSDLSDVHSCTSSIYSSFWNCSASNIKKDCCSVIQKLDGDCSSTVFGSFNNPFFQLYVKQHCANNA